MLKVKFLKVNVRFYKILRGYKFLIFSGVCMYKY